MGLKEKTVSSFSGLPENSLAEVFSGRFGILLPNNFPVTAEHFRRLRDAYAQLEPVRGGLSDDGLNAIFYDALGLSGRQAETEEYGTLEVGGGDSAAEKWYVRLSPPVSNMYGGGVPSGYFSEPLGMVISHDGSTPTFFGAALCGPYKPPIWVQRSWGAQIELGDGRIATLQQAGNEQQSRQFIVVANAAEPVSNDVEPEANLGVSTRMITGDNGVQRQEAEFSVWLNGGNGTTMDQIITHGDQIVERVWGRVSDTESVVMQARVDGGVMHLSRTDGVELMGVSHHTLQYQTVDSESFDLGQGASDFLSAFGQQMQVGAEIRATMQPRNLNTLHIAGAEVVHIQAEDGDDRPPFVVIYDDGAGLKFLRLVEIGQGGHLAIVQVGVPKFEKADEDDGGLGGAFGGRNKSISA